MCNMKKNTPFYIFLIFSMLFSSCAFSASQVKIFAYDYYLGFPVNNKKLQVFFTQHHFRLRAYRNIDQLILDLKKHAVSAAFIPAGALYYIKNDYDYEGIASATVGKQKRLTLNSYLIVKKSSGIMNLHELQNKKISYINNACTTSYMAPYIFFSLHHDPFTHIFSKWVVVNGFEQQIPSVINGKADATMVWDYFWLKNPRNINTTRIIGKINHLPTPVVVLNVLKNPKLKKPLQNALKSYQAGQKNHWLFSGFTSFQSKSVDQFLINIQSARVDSQIK